MINYGDGFFQHKYKLALPYLIFNIGIVSLIIYYLIKGNVLDNYKWCYIWNRWRHKPVIWISNYKHVFDYHLANSRNLTKKFKTFQLMLIYN
jgi:hypothetical protein